MLFGLGAQIVDVDVASRVAGDHHDLHADHAGGGRIGAVGRGGDQAHLAVRLAARGVIAADRQQPGIFALRAGIRLQRDRVIAGDVAQPLFQPREQRVIARGLLARRERMQAPNSGQVSGIISVVALSFMVQEPSGIMARSSARSRSREFAHVAQQLGLGAMGVEHRMGEEGGARASARPAAPRARRPRPRHRRACRRRRATPPRRSPASWSRPARCRACRSPMPQIDLLGRGAGHDLALLVAGVHRHGVEERLDLRRKAELAQVRPPAPPRGDARARAMCGQPLRAVIDRIHRGDHRQQHLRGADVGGRLFAADVLLAGLQRQPIGGLRRANRPTARRCGPGSERFSASRTAI